jgi:peptidyl-prolyl cis-trans isomerase C
MKLLQLCPKMMIPAVVVALILPLSAFAKDPVPAKTVKPAEPANVAKVNGKTIPYKDFERKLEIFQQQVMHGQPGQLPAALMDRARTQVVNQMISEELLYQESVKQKLKLDDGFVDEQLKSLKERFGDDAQYHDTLKRMHLTEAQLKGQIARQALIRKLIDKEVVSKIKISKEDAQKYYLANKAKFHQPEQVRAQHILIKVDPAADAKKKAEARKKLEAVKKRVLAGEDFGKLAKEYSEGPSNVREGDLGYFTRGRMVKPFEDAAFKLAPNEVSDIVETQFGYHLIKVLDHKAAKDPSFEEVEPHVMAILRNEKIQQKIEPYLHKLRKDAKVETYLN